MNEARHAERARRFFAAYAAHDVAGMLALFASGATFRYVPEGERGEGPITAAADIWRAFLAVMPDFAVEVVSLREGDGFAVVETRQGGTLSQDFGPIAAKGRSTRAPHCFIFDFDEAGLIARLTAYWDYNTIYRELGHTEEHA
jgi:steroid delta-isomerase-like uncharacterized protein